jgi:tRNA/rRNA methyltransferase
VKTQLRLLSWLPAKAVLPPGRVMLQGRAAAKRRGERRENRRPMAGTAQNRTMIAEGPAIILVEPQLGENIGMVARAMANFGLAELRLVNPRDGWPNEKAQAAASGAVHIIDNARVFDTLEEAVADLRHLYATTARQREMIKPVLGPEESARLLRGHFNAGVPAGILFGRERWGLTNEEVAICDAIVTFPVNPAFASLNIAQAVLLTSYEWLRSGNGGETPFSEPEERPATRAELVAFLAQLESALEEANYFHPPEKREKMALNLRNIFTHAGLKEPELRTLHGVVAALERRWKKRVDARAGEEAGE